jgi:uncharacterized membrane protein YbaN (DUF454 family)
MVFALGLIGIFLPLLPTTPFFFLALWFFSKGSEKCHDWLYNHPIFGKYIKIWKEHGVIPKNAKIIAISTMIISAILLVLYSSAPLYATVLAIACMCCAGTFILTRPSKPKESSLSF